MAAKETNEYKTTLYFIVVVLFLIAVIGIGLEIISN